MIDYAKLDQTWLVITPQSPFKETADLQDQGMRLEMVQSCIEDNPKLFASDVEFDLPRPNYTIDTLKKLQLDNPHHSFVLIMGEDNIVNFEKWKSYEQILQMVEVFVYPRPNTPDSYFKTHPKVTVVSCPLLDISSSFIRESIQNKHSIKYMVHSNVETIISKNNYFL